ncbi:MAG: 4Fe-4S dicluster domain-containing protein [Candidatus Aenigmatarchaeota archaeon]|nr:MAG: 4Fe-4S dicluster domain-containing protein [Candidatus Aenigmarchaeota archaeon]
MSVKCSWKEIPIAGVITRAASALDNKTGSWRAFRPVIDEKRCINCALCVLNCPDNAIPFRNGKRGKMDLDYCKGCGICSVTCPVKCIKMEEETEFKK